jgi:hypothetical protein
MSLTDEINKLRKWVTDNFSNKKDSPLLSLSKQGEMPQAEGLRTEFESKLSEIESNLKDHENTEILDSEIDTQFEHASKIHTDHNLTVSTTDVVAPGAKIQYVSNVLLQAESLLKSQQDTINQLQSDLNKSKAYPTMPDKKADPKINIHKKINTDDSGKVLLENIPDNVKRKLKTK